MSLPLSPERAELEDERAFLLRSLRDLDREQDAGDLTPSDYEALRDRYTARAAEVLRALAADQARATAPARGATAEPAGPAGPVVGTVGAGSPATPALRRRRARRRLGVAGAVTAFAAAAVVVVVASTGTRLPGDGATGSPRLGRAQQIQRTLDQAATLEGSGDVVGALKLYRQVLVEDPGQAQALAESGWLEFQAGVQAKDAGVVARAQQSEEAAEEADPGSYAPHLYLGSMLLTEGDARGAVAEFRSYLADDPPAAGVAAAAAFITKAYTEAGLPAPTLPSS